MEQPIEKYPNVASADFYFGIRADKKTPFKGHYLNVILSSYNFPAYYSAKEGERELNFCREHPQAAEVYL